MLKKFLKEVRELLAVLASAGYFDEDESVVSEKFGIRKVSTGKKRGPLDHYRKKGYKLYPNEVLDIYKEDRLSCAEIAEIYNVNVTTVYDIKSGYTWSKLTGHKGDRAP